MNRRLSWVRWDRRLKQIARDAGIQKRVFNHMLRHGSATRNAKFLTDSELKVMYGWSMSSKMPTVYVHLSGKDLDDKLTALYSGTKIEQKPEFTPSFVRGVQRRRLLGCSTVPSAPLLSTRWGGAK